MPDPVLSPIGESLWVIWRDRAALEFSRVSEHRDSLSAEVTVSNAAGTVLHWARVNLASTQGRAALVRALEEAEPTDDWRPIVERSCRMVAAHVRTGDPAVPLVAEAPKTDLRWAVRDWIPAGQITVLFGDGGAGKSFFALTLALSGLLGRPVTARWSMMSLRRVLYLDWEADTGEQQVRLWRLTAGLGSQPQDGAILHRTMRRPLRDEIAAVRDEAARGGVDFVICDSLAPASGPEPEHADAALSTLLALRSLAVTVLCIAHVSKAQADSKAPARPYGCYAADTEVLTRRGWKRHQDWKPGEAILAFDLDAEVLRWQCPSARHAYPYNGPMVRGHTEHSDFLVTPNHRLVIRPAWAPNPSAKTRRPRFPDRWQFRTAEALKKSWIRTPFATPLCDDIKDCGVVHVPGVGALAADDFLKALGWWVSEGSIDSPSPRGGALQWSQAFGPLADEMLATLNRLGWSVHRTIVRPQPGPRAHELPMQHLRLRGLSALTRWVRSRFGRRSYNKRLGAFVFALSARQRAAFLEALIDGDGRRWANGRREYYTCSRRLADDVQRLAILCGYGAGIRTDPPGQPHHRTRYTVKMSPKRWTSFGQALAPGLPREDYAGMVYCFTVPAGAYLTRRHGLMAIQGNSVHIQNLARSVIEARGSEADDQGESTVSLYHRKSNHGRRQPPSALRFTFDPTGPVRVAAAEADVAGTSLAYQILDALGRGPQEPGQLADELDAPPATVKKTLQRLERRDKVIRLEDRKIGGHKERLWGLVDTRRDTSRDTSEASVPADDNQVPF